MAIQRQADQDRRKSTLTTLTVTARRQVTFRKAVLQHLGIRPGDRIEPDLPPGGRGVLMAARPAVDIGAFVGLPARRSGKVARIDEISEAGARAWAGQE